MSAAQILDASDPLSLATAAEQIRRGGIVVFPTETVYGLGADALNPLAVARVFEAKRRPRMDPLIVHIDEPGKAERYGRIPGQRARRLLEEFWPGPLTVVVPRSRIVPDIVTAGLETVALRVPSHKVALDLIRMSGTAIAAPSANPFGYVSPTEARHVEQHMSHCVDIILDGGRCPVGVESTIVSLTDDPPRLLRAGGIPLEDIERIVGPVQRRTAPGNRPESPGQMERHYATHTPLEILPVPSGRIRAPRGAKVGLITLREPVGAEGYEAVEILSARGDLREAAANLFSALRKLDGMRLDRLQALPVEEQGLGLAIMDRLRRCSAGGMVGE